MPKTYSNDSPIELNNIFLTILCHSNVAKSFQIGHGRLMSLVNLCLDLYFKSYGTCGCDQKGPMN